MTELSQCPHCQGSAHVEDNGNGDHWVRCDVCRMTGPVVDLPEDARVVWNALPRRARNYRNISGAQSPCRST